MLTETRRTPCQDRSSRDFLREMRTERRLPKGVWLQVKTLKDGSRVYYGYYGRGLGSISLGRLGTAEFDRALAGLETRKSVPPGTLKHLIWRYKTSPDFSKLRSITKEDYRRKLDLIQARFGAYTVKQIEAQSFSAEAFAWRDEQGSTPRQADYGVQVLKLLLSWGCRRGLLEVNRAAGVDRLQPGKRGGRSWSEAQIEAFLALAPLPIRLALILALETGQRQGDLLRLRWSSVEQGLIQLTQSKTGVYVAIPISPRLQEALDQHHGAPSDFVLVKDDGRPWDRRGNGFRSAWRTTCQAAGIKGVTFHDLRGTFITRRLSEGWTTIEVAMCTGHALRDLASLDTYADRGALARALAARRFQQAGDRIDAQRTLAPFDDS